ncbi:uncharacterized protein LOC120848741 [Ixodes scapularis]|uniref:uncharacterized protein LOC120848741 n=1 Tax=Ixodes scapularis TaxID=6945 RepID=UPI001A9E5756|nr:uncharacterized protein LOC120848741 [Ixodes scapularis]
MSSVPAAARTGGTARYPVNVAVYADDVALWVTGQGGRERWRAVAELQRALDNVIYHLRQLGLTVSGGKTRALIYAPRPASFRPTLLIEGPPIIHEQTVTYLGLVLDRRLTWGAAVASVVQRMRRRMNTLRSLAGSTWGASQNMMLQLHQGLVLSVALYALPLLSLNTSQAANLETVHRIALRICLGISRSAASIPTYTEAGANTVSNHLQKRALGHLIRISTCESAAPLLARIAERPESHLGQLLCVLGDVAGPAPAITPLPPLHSDPHPLTVHLRVDGMGPRRRTADVVAKQLTEDHIERHHPGWARVYTDGSVRPSDGSSTAAVFVERADLGVGERFAFHATSTTTELAAILLALRLIHYKSRRPDSWLLLSDSQAALSQLYGLEGACPLAREIAGEALLLGGLGHRLAFQWVPSHCGIPGNERADALADRVHDAAEFRTSDVGPFADAKLLIAREAAANHPDERYAAGDRPAKPPRGTGRPAAAVVHRIRTGCALTPARMHLLRNEADPECPTCGEWSDLDHHLLSCPAHADARAAMTTSLAALGLPCNTTEQILRPRGDRRGKDRALRALLTFLEETGLLWSL